MAAQNLVPENLFILDIIIVSGLLNCLTIPFTINKSYKNINFLIIYRIFILLYITITALYYSKTFDHIIPNKPLIILFLLSSIYINAQSLIKTNNIFNIILTFISFLFIVIYLISLIPIILT